MIRFEKLFILITIVTVGSCESPNSKEATILKQWKTDKTGCDSRRLNIVNQNFEIFENLIIGKSRSYVLETLGDPNERFFENKSDVFSYFAEPGIQCMNIQEQEIDVFRVVLEFQNGKVKNVRKILP